ncbi:MAG: ABC transporter permease, partial [Thermomicrobiales bacterium]|nr:ABC transporter permease [Thermomicrobiales bacterium]
MFGRQLVERIVTTIPVLIIVSGLIFLLVHLAPGDPITVLAGDQALDPAVVERLHEQYGLNDPLPFQYTRWLGNTLQGDLGYSFTTRQPVWDAIYDRLTVTLQLTLFALVIAICVASPLGVLAAIYRNSAFDYLNQGLAMLGGSMPAFWLGILLILLFAQRLGWFPASGYTPFTESPLDCLKHLLLPAITLSSGYAAVLSRIARASMLDVLHEDYIRTARAKGLSESRVNIRHALRSALLPIITIVGMEAGHLL